MMEMLKMHSSLAIVKQAADNYAYTQIEAGKNKMTIEQKILETTSDIKLSNYKDNNDTRELLNLFNTENIRNDLQYEKIIPALHHHGHHHGHHHHGNHHGYHHGYHHHGYNVPHHNHFYNNYDNQRGNGGGRGGGGD